MCSFLAPVNLDTMQPSSKHKCNRLGISMCLRLAQCIWGSWVGSKGALYVFKFRGSQDCHVHCCFLSVGDMAQTTKAVLTASLRYRAAKLLRSIKCYWTRLSHVMVFGVLHRLSACL